MAKIDIDRTISGAKEAHWREVVDSLNEIHDLGLNRPSKATKNAKNVLFNDKTSKSAEKEPINTQNAIKNRYMRPYEPYGKPTTLNPNRVFKDWKKKREMLKLINSLGIEDTDSTDDELEW